MKLSKLYCNDEKFKTIKFKDRLNVIVGYGNKLSENDSHNLGKTSVIILVDYMLLKDIEKERSKEHFLVKKKEFFNKYEFYLEIEYDEGSYITIKRNVKDKKVSLKLHSLKYQNFVGEKEWDFENVTLKKAKKELETLLKYSTTSNFRKFLKFILRTQKDYEFRFRKNEVKDKDWKPYLMDMFGYNFKDFEELFKLKTEKEDIEKQLLNYSSDYFEQLDEKKNVKEIYENRIKDLEKQIKDYDYYKIDDSVNDELVKKINTDISKLNQQKYNLTFDIEKIKESLRTNINTLDIQELENIYKEAKIYFSELLKKDYDSLVEFNKQISRERLENLKNLLKAKEEELEKVNDVLQEKNKEQKKYFEILEVNKSVAKIIVHNNEVNKYKIKYAELAKELEVMEKNIQINQTLKDKIKKISDLIIKTNSEIDTNKNILKKLISDNFNEYTKNIFFDSEGKISVYYNEKGFPEMDMKLYSLANGEVTAEDNGNNYNKHMKCCFDLAVILSYIQEKKRYFKFVFHDGSIESSDNKLKVLFLDLVNKLCNEWKIQYITTAIYDEISKENVFSKIKEENIILKLNDAEDYSGTLFGKRF